LLPLYRRTPLVLLVCHTRIVARHKQ
jgi:hypothetical protein